MYIKNKKSAKIKTSRMLDLSYLYYPCSFRLPSNILFVGSESLNLYLNKDIAVPCIPYNISNKELELNEFPEDNTLLLLESYLLSLIHVYDFREKLRLDFPNISE